MISPRCDRILGKHSLVLAAAFLIGTAGRSLHAQDTAVATAPDTTARQGADTTARQGADTTALQGADTAGRRAADTTAGQGGMRPDSLAPDSLARDTAAAGSRPPGSPAPQPAPPAAPPPPVDSVLAAACRASAGEPPDLLTVVFRPTATAAEREAAARELGGTLLEPSQHQAPGAWYVHIPNSALDPTVANRLILQPPVLEVGATRCPS